MMPLPLDHGETATDATGSEYDRWEPTAYFAPDLVSIVNRELDRLAGLGPNWDGEGATPIDPATIAAARQFVARMPEGIASTPAVVPMRKGNLQFEWNDGPRSLELEIENPRTIHYLKWDREERIEDEDCFSIDDVDQVKSLIRWFMRSVVHV